MPLLPQHFLCPVLLNIGSSRAVTLPYFCANVRPSLTRAANEVAQQRSGSLAIGGISGRQLLSSAPPKVLMRPYCFSPENPQLQHESWSAAWKSYISAVRECGEVAAPGRAPLPPVAVGSHAAPDDFGSGGCFVSLAGPLTLALPVPLPRDPVGVTSTTEQGEDVMLMEFFRVDAFIPVRVQMYHVMRRLVKMQAFWNIVAIGIVVPTHEADYFITAVKNLRSLGNEGGANESPSTRPNVLVYDAGGLVFQTPRRMVTESYLESPMDYFFSALERRFPNHAGLISVAKHVLHAFIKFLDMMYPFAEALFSKLVECIRSSSERELAHVLPLTAGLAICFFGGCFFTLFATVEIVYLTSWDRIKQSAAVIRSNYIAAMECSSEDNTADEDTNGIPGAQRHKKNALLSRKLEVFLRSVDPVSVREELAALALAFMAVVAALRDRFAYYVTLGCIHVRTVNSFVPLMAILEESLPPEQRKLAGLIADFVLSVLGTMVAAMASQYTITFHSASRGSKLFVTSALELAKVRGIVGKDLEIDDQFAQVLTSALTVLGFAWQVANGFSMPFPLNVLLFPVTVLEAFVNAIFRVSGSTLWPTPLP